MPFAAHGLTHAGRVRTQNQDRILMLPELGCWAVFDGMGGQRGGERAAEIASTIVQHYVESSQNPSDVTWPFGYNIALSLDANRLLTSIGLANRQVTRQSEQDLTLAGMGTTVAAILIRQDRVAAANVGDSRVYRCRTGKLEQLSKDDTIGAMMVGKGVISPSELPTHPMRSILTQAVGSQTDLDVHIHEEQIDVGDLILLCSDGLYSATSEAAIVETLHSHPNPQAVAGALIEGALENGATDNVSAIVIEYS